MIIAFWGTFVMSLIIMVVSNIFELSLDEKKAVFFIKQTRSSGKSITLALKFWLSKKKWYKQKLKDDVDFDLKSSFMLMMKDAKPKDETC